MSENKPTPESTCPSALPFMITDQEMKDLMRFHECVTDGEGYDVPKERMKQLAEIGLLRRVTSDFYEHTTFGLSVINGDFQSADEIRKQRDELLAALEGLTGDIQSLIGESCGIAGLHMNGDIAPWSELEAGGRFERLTHLPDAHAAIASVKEGYPDNLRGFSIWFDREAWGHVIDGLMLERDRSIQRKAANPESNSDGIANRCAELIEKIADPDADCIEHHPKRQRLEKRERRCSMSHADKALAAILEYDRLMSAINDCRKIISNPANECDRAVTVEEWTYILDNKHSHIQEVLAGFIDSDGYAPEHRHFHRDEALEIIGDCEGCLKVFEAIQERKRLKAKLGSTKRTIRLIARNAMKGCAA